MAAGAFADLSSYKCVVRQLGELAQGPRGLRCTSAARRTASRTTPARASSPTAPTSSRRPASRSCRRRPRSTRPTRKKLLREEPEEGLLAGLHRRHRLVLRDGLRLRLRRRASRQQVSGKWKGLLDYAEVDRRPDRVQELLPGHVAGEQDDRRDAPEPLRRLRTGPGRLDDRAELVQLLRRQGYTASTAQFVMPGHVKGQAMPGFLGGSDLAVPVTSSQQGARRRLDQGLHEHELREGAPGEGQHPERDQPARRERQRAGRRRGAGSSRRRSTGSTSRTATSCATCWRRSSPAS